MNNPIWYRDFYYIASRWRHAGDGPPPAHCHKTTLDRHLDDLEADLKSTLIDRKTGVLTPAGAKLFRHLRPFFDPLPRLEEELRAGNHDTPGQAFGAQWGKC
jgi:hypothetical protein